MTRHGRCGRAAAAHLEAAQVARMGLTGNADVLEARKRSRSTPIA
jgi:hypothetical protein